MSEPADYSSWLTKQQAADAIGVTTKTVERFVQAGQIQQTRWQREGRGPLLAVYEPSDVARIASERKSGPPVPFLMPPGSSGLMGPAGNGNGHHAEALERVSSGVGLMGPGEDLLTVLVTAAMRVMSQTSETSALFLTVKEAAAVSGLTQAYLRRLIEAKTLPAIRDRGWRIRRKDLELL